MLKEENKCYFDIVKPYAGCNEGTGYYGFIVKFDYAGHSEYDGVIAPNMRDYRWILFPLDCVKITQQPKVPIISPAYEVDE